MNYEIPEFVGTQEKLDALFVQLDELIKTSKQQELEIQKIEEYYRKERSK